MRVLNGQRVPCITGATTSTAFSDIYGRDNHATMRDSATVRAVEDYTNKYKPRVSIPFEPLCLALQVDIRPPPPSRLRLNQRKKTVFRKFVAAEHVAVHVERRRNRATARHRKERELQLERERPRSRDGEPR